MNPALHRAWHTARLRAAAIAAADPRGRGGLLLHLGIGASAAAFLLLRLFAGGTVGMSDQGAGFRLLCGLGLRQSNPYNSSTLAYLYPVWPSHSWFGEDCGAPGSDEQLVSTQLWFASLGKLLTGLLTSVDGLDLRVLGVVLALLAGALVAAVVALVPGRFGVRAGIALALLLVLGDGTFAGYLVSSYAEPAGFLGLLLLLVAVLLLFRAPRLTWRQLAAVAAAAMFAVADKGQTAALALPAVAVLLARPSHGAGVAQRLRDEAPYERSTGATARRGWLFAVSRWPAIAVSAALLAGTGGFLAAQPQRLALQSDYAAVFAELLPHSPDRAGDLRALGLPEAMAGSSGLAMSDSGSAASNPAFQDFGARAGLADRLGFYARRPIRLVGMFGRGLAGMSELRPAYVFSYPPGAGNRPNRQECRVCVLQAVWRGVLGAMWPVIVPLFLGAVWLCGTAARGLGDRRSRAVGAAGLFLAGVVVTQFWTVMLTGGAADLTRNLVFANLAFALLLVFSAASMACLRAPERAAAEAEHGWEPVPGPRDPLDPRLPSRAPGLPSP